MTLWRDIVDRRFGGLHDSAEDKTMTLGEAVRKFVRPGMKLNPVSLQSRPCAAVYEIARAFRGQDPQFEFISSSMGGTYLPLVHLGLLKKIIVSFAGEGYPTPGPSPVIWRALAQKKLEIENMTMLTVSQRLMGGALGVPFVTTRSLAGSSIGEELAGFTEIDDPFGGGRAGLLQSYNPDVAFVHVWAADPAGNALTHPPYGENIYGALAAREGVILTADHIVDTDFIRRHASLGRIPSRVVRAVCHAPFGSHPAGNYCSGVPELESYGNDYKFITEHRNAQKDPAAYDKWLKEWVFDTADHAGYVKKLAAEGRIDYIRFMAEPEGWRKELEDLQENMDDSRGPNEIETMIIHAGHAMAERVREHGYRNALAGVGQATLLSVLAWNRLRDQGIDFTLMAETGIYGYDPRPSDPFVFSFRNLPTTTTLGDITETLGMHTGGATNECIGAIGAAQVDRHGNVNSTRMGGMHIVGSGGANDIASAARETLVIAQLRPGMFVDRVEYVTSPGRHVRCVITTMGRFEKRDDEGDLILTGYNPAAGANEAEIVAEIKNRVKWDLKVADNLTSMAEPTPEEVTLLRIHDPERLFLGKAMKKEAATAGA